MPYKHREQNKAYQRPWKKNKRAERSEDPRLQDQEVEPLEPNDAKEALLDTLRAQLRTLETEAHPYGEKIRDLSEQVRTLHQDLGLAGIQQQHLKKDMDPEETVFRRRELREKEETLALYEQQFAAKRDEIRRKSEEITKAEQRAHHLQRAISNLEGSRLRTEANARDLRSQGQRLIDAANRVLAEHQAALVNSKAELRRLTGSLNLI